MHVVDADDDISGLGGLLEQPRLHRDIVLHAAVAVEMIGREIAEHRHVRHQAGRKFDLVGRDFQHIDRPGGWRRQLQNRLADIAAGLGVEAAGIEDMGDQRGCRRFAVGAGDGDDRRTFLAHLASEQFDVADDLGRGRARANDDLVRAGMGERYAGAQDERLQPVPRPIAPGQDDCAFRFRQNARGFLVVPGINARASGLERADGGKPAARQPEDADILMREGTGRDHLPLTAISTSRGRSAPARPPRSRSG